VESVLAKERKVEMVQLEMEVVMEMEEDLDLEVETDKEIRTDLAKETKVEMDPLVMAVEVEEDALGNKDQGVLEDL